MKPADLLADPEWTREYIQQVRKLRFVEVGGVLKNYVRGGIGRVTNEELVHVTGKLGAAESEPELFFRFVERWMRYCR